MLIEQIIEFEMRRPGPPGRTCTPTTDYFHDKTKVSKENVRVDYVIIFWKILQEAMQLYSPTWAKSLTKFNLKM